VAGKKVTGFANSEEAAVSLPDMAPFLIEDMLEQNGSIYLKGNNLARFVTTDGKLVTGQNPAFSEAAGKNSLNCSNPRRQSTTCFA
jgi:putative intracellular protease/amidase